MAALASVSPWIPEDDLLLKNAVESGASLEALAKGAVRFSRKFSVVELRDRWHSLLYEPNISSEASSRMVEFQLSASNSSSKPNRSGNLEVPAKRNLQSIRKLYYAMRKKICRQPCNSSVLGFLNAPNFDDFTGDGVDCSKPLMLENELPVGNHMLGDYVLNDFELQEVQMDMSHHVYPHMESRIAPANVVGGTTNAFQNVGPKSLEGNNPNGVVSRDIINDYPEKVPYFSAKESVRDDSEISLEDNNVCIDGPLILGDNQVDLRNFSTAEDMKPSHALPDCSVSFHSVGVSSPLPGSPLWKTIEDISAPDMPINDGLEDKGQNAEETLIRPDDVDSGEIMLSRYDVVQSGTMLKDRHNCDETNGSSVILERDFVDLSDSLLNFPNEDEHMFMNDDEKDTVDIVLSPPKDGHEGDACVQEPQKLASDSCLAIEAIADSSHPVLDVEPCICDLEINMPSSASIPNPCYPELDDAPINCILNTEDPEIPCNDDILSPIASASYVIQPSYKEAGDHTSRRDSKIELNIVKKEENLERSYIASPMVAVDMLPGTISKPYINSGLKSEFNDDSSLSMVCRPVNDAYAESRECRSGNMEPNSTTNGSGPSCNATDVALYADSASPKNALPEPEANPSTSEQYESDDDIPQFSDIEAMILEMDLCPDDQDSCISKEVLRYQQDNAKRTIIRLEQCAKSSMRRAMSSRGALAILYGRHFKHYIKRTEVILGRATGDIDVDIDLGREGRANKISRRQALIKMEGDGSFSLKNIGKSSILLNGREIATGQVMNLKSSSLIEIRDLSFVFEINHKPLTQFLSKAKRKRQENDATFEWLDKKD